LNLSYAKHKKHAITERVDYDTKGIEKVANCVYPQLDNLKWKQGIHWKVWKVMHASSF